MWLLVVLVQVWPTWHASTIFGGISWIVNVLRSVVMYILILVNPWCGHPSLLSTVKVFGANLFCNCTFEVHN